LRWWANRDEGRREGGDRGFWRTGLKKAKKNSKDIGKDRHQARSWVVKKKKRDCRKKKIVEETPG